MHFHLLDSIQQSSAQSSQILGVACHHLITPLGDYLVRLGETKLVDLLTLLYRNIVQSLRVDLHKGTSWT